MSRSYEESFRKIAPMQDLPDGVAKTYRAAGATVVLTRRGDRVDAEDCGSRAPLSTRVEEGWAWVCLDGCEIE